VSRIWIYWQTVMRSTSSPTSPTDTGQFYEWAVDQADSNEASSTVPRHAPAVASAAVALSALALVCDIAAAQDQKKAKQRRTPICWSFWQR